ncbi:tyrosine-type recombinase/integrase [Lactobacillus crispatus]|uniref:Integrase n=1 Tax=Lactobacillus crispatus TaxID=47770 RepID=A0A109DG42_9LACO|nr:tyrosine-type recombinase/integrase [Lactobacillus crispatus]KWU04813.1 integrase [Lactobacillus crispatus]
MIKKVIKGKHVGQWKVRIQPVDKATGKRISFPVQYANSKKEAIKLERNLWAEYEDGLNFSDGKVSFAKAFQKYVDRRANTISPVTLKSWQESANDFNTYFGNTQINKVTTQLVSDYAHEYVEKNQVTVSRSSTIAKRLVHMRNFFKSIEGKVVKENPVPEGALKLFFKQSDFTVPKEWYIFSSNELDEIRNLIEKDLQHSSVMNVGSKLAILIESYTGMRIGELQALKFNNVVYEDSAWTFRINDSWSDYTNSLTGALKARPKGYSRTLLPLPKAVIDLVRQYEIKQKDFIKKHDLENPLDLVFINLHDYKAAANDQPIRQKSVNMMLKNICDKLNIQAGDKQLSMYSFRHTICTNLANTPGMSYPWAAEKMGHSLQMFMNTYVGVDPNMNEKMNKLWVS